MRFLLTIILGLSISSCNTNRKEVFVFDISDFEDCEAFMLSRFIELSDDIVVNTIKDYANEFKIDKNKYYLLLQLGGDTRRKTISITNGYRGFSHGVLPLHYTVINGYLTFIQSEVDYLSKGPSENDISCYQKLLNQFNIVPDSVEFIRHPPVWRLEICSGKYELNKKDSRIYFYDTPCGYIIRANDRLDSLWIEKEE